MLEDILLKHTSVDLYFKKEQEKDIFNAISESLLNFYDTYYKGYRFYNARFDEGRTIERNATQWVYRLFHEFSEDKLIIKGEEKKILGFINLYKNEPMRYNLRFCIRESRTSINNYSENFETDEETSIEHAEKYFKFIKDNKLN